MKVGEKMSLDYSEFAIPKSKSKKKKHNRTYKTNIPKSIKEKVWERDLHHCIICGRYVPLFFANAHFIPRSAGGLGIEENIFTACEYCHREQDNGLNSKDYDEVVENYLKNKYGSEWDKTKLIYTKY